MTNRNDPNTNELAETIRRRLERSAASATAVPTADPTNTLRATKDGQILAPGESPPVGPDGKPTPTLTVPDSTFHGRRRP